MDGIKIIKNKLAQRHRTTFLHLLAKTKKIVSEMRVLMWLGLGVENIFALFF